MKIAITGHSAGIGKEFAEILAARGHEIVGLSKRTGDNIRIIPKILDKIEPCDMFINNAQAGYAQTELLQGIHSRWKMTEKHVWVIGTMMTHQAVAPEQYLEYYNQKQALELAIQQLRHVCPAPQITLIRPGGVATHGKEVSNKDCNVNLWCNTIIDTLLLAESRGMRYSELSLGNFYKPSNI
jgi:hypothetical protein